MSDAAEIIKSGAAGQFMDLIHKLAGPACEEFGLTFGDKARAYRLRNLVATAKKTRQKLKQAGLPENAVPTRLLLPIIENCSVEDNETLQGMWAGLLASASQRGDAISPAFIETLKQLTPDEARYFEAACRELVNPNCISRTSQHFSHWGILRAKVSADSYERLGLIRREYAALNTLPHEYANVEDLSTEVTHRYVLTDFGVRFYRACTGPVSNA